MIKKNNIYKFLDLVKTRPLMYIGNYDINNLFIFIEGYKLFFWFNKIEKEETPKFNLFHDYIAVLYGYKESTSGWANMLNENSKDGKEALDKFFKHLDDFKRDLKGKNREEIISFLENKGYKINYNFEEHCFD